MNLLKLEVNSLNINLFLEFIPSTREKDIYSWNLFNYLFWKKRNININYLLIFIN